MVIELLCLGDVLALAVGACVVWRAGWRGVAADVALLGALAVLTLAAFGVAGRTLGGFAMLRALCHGLFCVALPLCLLRAVRLRRERPGFAVLLALVALAGEGCYVWARRVEPFRLEVTTQRLTTKRLAGLSAPLRIAVVADLQTDAMTAFETTVFDRIVAADPDLVLFAGDYLQLAGDAFARELPALHAQLRRLRPRLGSYAVDGDVDLGGARAVFAGTDVRVLVDETVALPGVPLDVIGLSRAKSRAPFVDAGTVRRLGGARYPIVLGHAPDFMLSALRDGYAPDALFVAGHTHGGQVQLPFVGPLLTLSSVPRWLAGGGVFQHGPTWLVCSRGLGMERDDAPRIRFLCRPQLIVLELAGA